MKRKATREDLTGTRHAVPLQTQHDEQTGVAPEPERPLSPALAFVVQFRVQSNGTSERFTGRVEHMISGDAVRFRSPEQLLTFFNLVLSAAHTNLSKER